MGQIKKIIAEIKKKPDMYLGRSTIFCFNAYLLGVYRFLSLEEVVIMNEFQAWIEDKYTIKSGQSWVNILIFYSSNEFDALQLFFSEFEEFQSIKST